MNFHNVETENSSNSDVPILELFKLELVSGNKEFEEFLKELDDLGSLPSFGTNQRTSSFSNAFSNSCEQLATALENEQLFKTFTLPSFHLTKIVRGSLIHYLRNHLTHSSLHHLLQSSFTIWLMEATHLFPPPARP